jgi:hypothetical protein
MGSNAIHGRKVSASHTNTCAVVLNFFFQTLQRLFGVLSLYCRGIEAHRSCSSKGDPRAQRHGLAIGLGGRVQICGCRRQYPCSWGRYVCTWMASQCTRGSARSSHRLHGKFSFLLSQADPCDPRAPCFSSFYCLQVHLILN